MNAYLKGCALSALLLVCSSSIVRSQTPPSIFDFVHMGIPYVGIRADKWEDVVARRIVSNELNRERAISIVQLVGKVDASEKTESLLRREVADERTLKNQARSERDQAIEENGKLTGKVKRKNKKITVLFIPAIYGAAKGVQVLVPQFLPWLP